MTIFLIRHGETTANKEGIFQGKNFEPNLTDLGVDQAQKTGKFLLSQNVKFDRIISSTSTRAKQTAQIICQNMGFDEKKITYTDLIREGDNGELTGKPRADIKQLEAKLPKAILDEKAILEPKMSDAFYFAMNYERYTKAFEEYAKAFGAETDTEIRTRIESFIQTIDPNENIAIVCHNGFINKFIQFVCKVLFEPTQFTLPDQKNCHITIISNKFELLLPRYNLHLK